MEGPKEIWIEKDSRTGLFFKYFTNRPDFESRSVEAVPYIRKDIYNDLDKAYFKLHETGTGHNYGLQCQLDEAQARIKELESRGEGFYGRACSMQLTKLKEQRDRIKQLEEALELIIDTDCEDEIKHIARKLLEKESE